MPEVELANKEDEEMERFKALFQRQPQRSPGFHHRRPLQRQQTAPAEDSGSRGWAARYEELIVHRSSSTERPLLDRSSSMQDLRSRRTPGAFDDRGASNPPPPAADHEIRSIESPPAFNNFPTAVRHGRESPLTLGFGPSLRRSLSTERPVEMWALEQQRQHTEGTANATMATTDIVKPFTPGPIRVNPDPTQPPPNADEEPHFRLVMPRSLPSWFLITYTYSLVLVLILLVSNVVPDGKLYVHFVAFWSIVLYVLLDEEHPGVDPLETLVESFMKKRVE